MAAKIKLYHKDIGKNQNHVTKTGKKTKVTALSTKHTPAQKDSKPDSIKAKKKKIKKK